MFRRNFCSIHRRGLILDHLLSGFIGGSVPLLAIWIFKEAILAKLNLSVGKAVAEHKHQLDIFQEHLKIGLQKDFLVQQSLCGEKFSIYPEVYKKIIIAQGSVSPLAGISYDHDWSSLSDEEVRRIFLKREVDEAKISMILSTRANQPAQGADQLASLARDLNVKDAYRSIQEAKNEVLKNALFMKEPLFDSAWKACVELSHAMVSLKMIQYIPGGIKDVADHMKAAENEIANIKILFRRELGVVLTDESEISVQANT